MPISGSIFQGVTTSPCRDYISDEIISRNPSKVYMPCAGRFGSAEAYANLFGSSYIPKEAAQIIRDAVDKMIKDKTVCSTNKWQAIEYWAADYLAGA